MKRKLIYAGAALMMLASPIFAQTPAAGGGLTGTLNLPARLSGAGHLLRPLRPRTGKSHCGGLRGYGAKSRRCGWHPIRLILGLALIESLTLYALIVPLSRSNLVVMCGGGFNATPVFPLYETPRHLQPHHHALQSRRRAVESQGPAQHREVERHGTSGYVVVASTGESVMLGTDEKIQLWEWVAQWAAPEKLLIAGTGMDSVHQTVALTNRAADIGYKAALVKTPSFFKGQFSNPETQMLFFRAVADQAKIPVLLYNFPQNTGVDLAAEAVAELSHHPNIVGIKESSGNVEKLMQMVRETKKGFQVLTGSATTLAPSLAIGCSGGILAFANPAPYATISIWEAHRTREPEAALDWQNRIGRAAKLVTTKYGIGGLKYAMDLTGYYGGPPRLPLTVPTPAAKQEIEEAFADLRG